MATAEPAMPSVVIWSKQEISPRKQKEEANCYKSCKLPLGFSFRAAFRQYPIPTE
jgi:hypothetical protein